MTDAPAAASGPWPPPRAAIPQAASAGGTAQVAGPFEVPSAAATSAAGSLAAAGGGLLTVRQFSVISRAVGGAVHSAGSGARPM